MCIFDDLDKWFILQYLLDMSDIRRQGRQDIRKLIEKKREDKHHGSQEDHYQEKVSQGDRGSSISDPFLKKSYNSFDS